MTINEVIAQLPKDGWKRNVSGSLRREHLPNDGVQSVDCPLSCALQSRMYKGAVLAAAGRQGLDLRSALIIMSAADNVLYAEVRRDLKLVREVRLKLLAHMDLNPDKLEGIVGWE